MTAPAERPRPALTSVTFSFQAPQSSTLETRAQISSLGAGSRAEEEIDSLGRAGFFPASAVGLGLGFGLAAPSVLQAPSADKAKKIRRNSFLILCSAFF